MLANAGEMLAWKSERNQKYCSIAKERSPFDDQDPINGNGNESIG